MSIYLKSKGFFSFFKKSASHENYFDLAPSYPFTNLNLKKKRILAFLLKKLMLIPAFKSLIFLILTYFSQTYNMTIEKIEEDLCEV